MTGDDFFSLAAKLSAGSSAAELRTSISRAYYGAFHTACELLVSVGISLPETAECHAKVSQILDNSGDTDVTKASSKLSSLRSIRNNADYDLDDGKCEKKGFAVLQLKTADEIITSIKSRYPNGAIEPLHEALRRHAKDILKWPVRPI